MDTERITELRKDWKAEEIMAVKQPCCLQKYSLTVDVPPYTALVFEY